MEPYTKSPVREGMRKRNEGAAQNEAARIEADLEANLRQIVDQRNKPIGRYYTAGIVAFFIVLVVTQFNIGTALFVGLAAIGGAWYFANSNVRNRNQSNADERQRLRDEAGQAIAAVYDRAEKTTLRQVAEYDNRVSRFRSSCNPASISRMADHNVRVFLEGLTEAEAKAGNYSQFVKFDFTFDVAVDHIDYMFDGQPVDDRAFDFQQERYSRLDSTAEAEGLAAVLMKSTLGKLKPRFQGKFANVNNEHNDALVTIHFSMPNSRFVPATSYN